MDDTHAAVQRLVSQLESRLMDLENEFYEALEDKLFLVLNSPDYTGDNIYDETPKILWNDKMHDIWGQARAINMCSEYLTVIIEGTKPLLLE